MSSQIFGKTFLKNLEKIKIKFFEIFALALVFAGVQTPLLYFITGAQNGSYSSLVNYSRPAPTMMISPLPVVFDSTLFFSHIYFKITFTDFTSQYVLIDKKFISGLPFSNHLRLHISRYSISTPDLKVHPVYKYFFCHLSNYVSIVPKNKVILSFTNATYVPHFGELDISKNINPLTYAIRCN